MNKFLGCSSTYLDSDIVLFGAPFDGTASFRKGARLAPKAMREISEEAIETYSPYQNKDLSSCKIHDLGDLIFLNDTPIGVIDIIRKSTTRLLSDNKRPVMIGGDHLVTLGTLISMAEKYNDLNVIHFDAHADLRNKYEGQKLSHATVMRRVHDLVGDGRIYQYGIRSGEKEEFEWAKSHVDMNKYDCSQLSKAVYRTSGKPVYITIDIDVLDPGEMPGTGTPEAGGVSFTELLKAVISLSDSRIVGADIVEVSPPCDPGGASTATACKLLRELLLVMS